MADGNGDEEGRGLWLARAPKLALVGVVASSRLMFCSWLFGAALDRGVKGFVSSALWPWGSGASGAVLTGLKVAIIVLFVRCNSASCRNDGRGWGSPSWRGGGRDSQEVGRIGWKRWEAMKGMIYQHIKTYEM